MPKVSLPLASGTTRPGYPTGETESVAPAIYLGASVNLAYEAAAGASQRAGPFATAILRLALASGNVRIATGDGTVVATATATLLVGPGTEYIAIERGEYLAALSNDTTAGSLNITESL